MGMLKKKIPKRPVKKPKVELPPAPVFYENDDKKKELLDRMRKARG